LAKNCEPENSPNAKVRTLETARVRSAPYYQKEKTHVCKKVLDRLADRGCLDDGVRAKG
jgi:hypothetical protein